MRSYVEPQVIGAVLALIVVWRILTLGFDALLPDGGTASALLREPGSRDDPELVQAALEDTAPTAVWRGRFARNPTNTDALLAFALDLEKQGKRAEAADAIEQALKLDPAYPRLLVEAGRFYLRSGDEQHALPILRRTVDLYPQLGGNVFPTFVAQLDSAKGRAFVIAAARDDPRWWPAFFLEACEKADVGAVQQVFVERAEAGSVTDTERACIINRAQREGRWAEARRLWVASLPREQRNPGGGVFNGGFEVPLASFGFNWIAGSQGGPLVDTRETAGARGTRALRVAFADDRYAGPLIYQYLMLSPGRYRLEGVRRADGFQGDFGLQWSVYCVGKAAEQPRQLATTGRLTGSGEWSLFRQPFAVPSSCAVQVLRLELGSGRDAKAPGSGTRLSGTAWFDDISVLSID